MELLRSCRFWSEKVQFPHSLHKTVNKRCYAVIALVSNCEHHFHLSNFQSIHQAWFCVPETSAMHKCTPCVVQNQIACSVFGVQCTVAAIETNAVHLHTMHNMLHRVKSQWSFVTQYTACIQHSRLQSLCTYAHKCSTFSSVCHAITVMTWVWHCFLPYSAVVLQQCMDSYSMSPTGVRLRFSLLGQAVQWHHSQWPAWHHSGTWYRWDILSLHWVTPTTFPSYVFVQISPGSSSPRLSNHEYFPTFLRSVASDTSTATGIVKLMQHLKWKHVAIITQEEDIFTLVSITCIEPALHPTHYYFMSSMLEITMGASGALAMLPAEICPHRHFPLWHTHVVNGFQLCHFRQEMSLMRRRQNRGSMLFTQSVFQLIRNHNHLYRTCKWVIWMKIIHHLNVTCKALDFQHTYRSQVEGSFS